MSLQKNPKILVTFLLNSEKTLSQWFEIVILKNKKSWIIAFLKLFKELIKLEDENIFVLLNDEAIKKFISSIFFKYFSSKNNLIKSIFLEIFTLIINIKKQFILVISSIKC